MPVAPAGACIRMLDGQRHTEERSSPASLAGPAVPMCPERALWTCGPLGIVDPFLVRAANDAIHERDRYGLVRVDENAYLTGDLRIGTHIRLFGEPALERMRFRTFSGNDSHCNLRGPLIIRAVERHCGHRIAAKATTRLLL